MYIDLNKTLAAIGKCLPAEGEPTPKQLRRMYELTQRLMSQELGAIYDLETFGGPAWQEQATLARQHAAGNNVNDILDLLTKYPKHPMYGKMEKRTKGGRDAIQTPCADNRRTGTAGAFSAEAGGCAGLDLRV